MYNETTTSGFTGPDILSLSSKLNSLSINNEISFPGWTNVDNLSGYILKQLNNGNPVLIFSSNFHHAFVVTGHDNSRFYVNDPSGKFVRQINSKLTEDQLASVAVSYEKFSNLLTNYIDPNDKLIDKLLDIISVQYTAVLKSNGNSNNFYGTLNFLDIAFTVALGYPEFQIRDQNDSKEYGSLNIDGTSKPSGFHFDYFNGRDNGFNGTDYMYLKPIISNCDGNNDLAAYLHYKIDKIDVQGSPILIDNISKGNSYYLPTIFKFQLSNLSGGDHVLRVELTSVSDTSKYDSWEFPFKITTSYNLAKPSVTTTPITVFTSTSASVGGNVTSDDGYTVTDRGVYWGESANPETTGTKLQIGSGTGSYTYNLSGLSPNKTYYIKAYAINSQGTSYGDEVSFKTSQIINPIDGLVAYYPFNGNANDESGNGNNGTVYLASLTTDRFTATNKAYSFNGTGSKISIPDNSAFTSTNQITVSAWVNATTTWTYNAEWIVCKETGFSSGFALGIDQNNSIYGNGNYAAVFYTWTSTGTFVVYKAFPSTELYSWKHIVGTYDGTTIKLFINGVEVSSKPLSGTILSSNNPINIGAQNTRSDQNFIGKIDDVRIYNKAISSSEINNLYIEGGYSQLSDATDIEGNSYKTVQIGTQVWMSENLKTTKFNDNSAIPYVSDNSVWESLSTPGYCWYNNGEASYKAIYGGLYNWYTVRTGILCPTGWHVSTDTDWATLRDFLGGENVSGNLKETGSNHWSSPNTGASNETDFTALPGGYRYGTGGTFDYIGWYGDWWSSTESPEYGSNTAWKWEMCYNNTNLLRNWSFKGSGYSVRCVKDK